MKVLLLKLFFVVYLINPDSSDLVETHSTNTGELNLAKLNQIEELICKKTGVEFESYVNSFSLNGFQVTTEVEIRKYGSSIYEETFYEIDDPEHICKIRLVKKINGDRELAVLIKNNGNITNYHAVFDYKGEMLETDPWGIDDGYTIETFDLYNKYRNLFSEKVDGIKYAEN